MENMEKSRDGILSLCGRDSLGYPNALVIIENMIAYSDGTEAGTVSEKVLENACVNIFKGASMLTIDLTYEDPDDEEFIRTADMLNEFCTCEMSMKDRKGTPAICITVCPRGGSADRTYIVGIHAAWNLQPSKPGKRADTIRFIVENYCFKVFEVENGVERLKDSDELFA